MSHQLHSILYVGATKPTIPQQKNNKQESYTIFFLSGLDFVEWLFFSLLSRLAQKEDHHPRQTRLQTRCPPWEASTSGRRRPQGWDWGRIFPTWEVLQLEKRGGEWGISRMHVHIMCICIYLWDTIISLLPFLWLRSLSFELCFFSSSLS